MFWLSISFCCCFCVISVIKLSKHTNFYAIWKEISNITFPTISCHVISYLPSFLTSFFLSFAFCGTPDCFQAIISLCNISLLHSVLSSDFIYSFQISYLGFSFIDTAAFFVLSFFSHIVQLVLSFTCCQL